MADLVKVIFKSIIQFWRFSHGELSIYKMVYIETDSIFFETFEIEMLYIRIKL